MEDIENEIEYEDDAEDDEYDGEEEEEEETNDDEEDEALEYEEEKITIPKEAMPDLIDFISDIVMVYGVDRSVKAHAEHSEGKTFYYR